MAGKTIPVRVLVQMSGTRNGKEWPPVGGIIPDMPVEEAADYFSNGVVEAVRTDEVESAAVDTRPRKRTSGLTKGNTGL